jgi:phosphoglucosamine mutase
VVAALQVLAAMQSAHTDLATLCAGMQKLPQHMINVPVAAGVDIENNPQLNEAVAAVEKNLGERGRVLLRPSGTEPLVRVMIEGEDAVQVENLCRELANRVESVLG